MRHRAGFAIFALFVTLSTSPLAAQGWVDRTTWNGPPPRQGHAMCYDPVHGYTILAGGIGSSGYLNDTWTWDGTSWTQRAASPGIYYSAMAFHAPSGEVLFATWTGGALATFAWDGTAWQSRGTVAEPSNNVLGVAMAYDAGLGQTALYAHYNGFGSSLIHTWNGITWTTHPVLATPLINYGCNSSYSMLLAWDPTAGKIVGLVDSGCPGIRYYEWNGVNWHQRFPSTPPRSVGAMATDTSHGRIIMFDSDYLSLQPNHTWTVANGVTTQLATALEPMLRFNSAMAFDSSRGVAVLFGGNNYSTPMGDTWEFDLGATATYTSFGGGCLGSRGTPHIAPQSGSLPRIGTTFTLQATNLPWTGAVFLYLGLSDTQHGTTALPFALDGLGAPTCSVLCSGDELHVLPNALGSSSWSFVVPPYPGVVFYNQVFPLDPGANTLGLTTSNGGRGVIGL